MRRYTIINVIILGVLLSLMASCELEEVPCEQCADNYDANGQYIGKTCWPVRCCEIYYPYECIQDEW